MNADMFLQGQRDCQEGLQPQSSNPDYLRGYAIEYERQAMVDYWTDKTNWHWIEYEY